MSRKILVTVHGKNIYIYSEQQSKLIREHTDSWEIISRFVSTWKSDSNCRTKEVRPISVLEKRTCRKKDIHPIIDNFKQSVETLAGWLMAFKENLCRKENYSGRYVQYLKASNRNCNVNSFKYEKLTN